MNRETEGHDGAIGSRERAGLVSFALSAVSDRLSWVGMEAACYSDLPDMEVAVLPLTHQTIVPVNRLPDEMNLRYEDVYRCAPQLAGLNSIIPAGSPVRSR
jgi:hypothetical protein